jgi:hypothetical protein
VRNGIVVSRVDLQLARPGRRAADLVGELTVGVGVDLELAAFCGGRSLRRRSDGGGKCAGVLTGLRCGGRDVGGDVDRVLTGDELAGHLARHSRIEDLLLHDAVDDAALEAFAERLREGVVEVRPTVPLVPARASVWAGCISARTAACPD